MRTRPIAERLSIGLKQLDLSVRTYNGMKNAGLETIGLIREKSEPELLRTKNFGRKSLNELIKILKQLDLPLPDAAAVSNEYLEPMRALPLTNRLALKIVNMPLTTLSTNALINAGLHTLGQIVEKTETELLRTKTFGRKSLNELKEILEILDLHLADPAGPPNLSDRSS